MITTADPRGIPLIVGTMNHRAFKDSGGSTPRGGTSSFDRYRVRMTPGARKWARPDLDWRPSGYQPDAPTRLSYGPVGARKLVTRLKRSASGGRDHRFERVRAPIQCARIDPRNRSEDVIPVARTGQKRSLSSHQIRRTGTSWR